MTYITPENRSELTISLLDPQGRKTHYGSRVIRVPEWVEEGEVLVVHGPPAPTAALVVVLPSKHVVIENRGGNVVIEEAALVA